MICNRHERSSFFNAVALNHEEGPTRRVGGVLMIGFLTSESGSGVFRSQAPVRVCSLPVQKPTTLLLSETTHDRNGAVRRIQCLCKSARNIYPFDPPVPPVSGHRSVFFYAKCKGVVTPAHSPKFCNSFLQYCLFCYYLLLRSH